MACRYPATEPSADAVAGSHRSPSKTSMAFQAGTAAMRGMSPGPRSYSPASNESEPPIPSGGTTRPRCPLPMKGDGFRPGSSVESTKAESAALSNFAPWACSGVAKSACPHQSSASAASAPGVILRHARATTTPAADSAAAPSKVVLHRYRHAAGQDRPGQKDRAGAHQPRVAFLQPLALERVQQVDVERRPRPEPVRAAEVEVIVRRERGARPYDRRPPGHVMPVAPDLDALGRVDRRGVADRGGHPLQPLPNIGSRTRSILGL